MSHNAAESWDDYFPRDHPTFDAGPLGVLPRLSRRRVQLEQKVGTEGSRLQVSSAIGGLADLLGDALQVDRFEIAWRAAGLSRPGVVAQMSWPRLRTRIGFGLEPPVAHALVDRLLGFDRLAAEGRLQVTPVEWGILAFAIARAVEHLDHRPGPFGAWDLTIDRVGPDSFDPAGLGPMVTWRWRVQVGRAVGSARLWLPESLIARWLLEGPPEAPDVCYPLPRYGELSGHWRAEAGTTTLPRGLSRLKTGALLLFDGDPPRGTPRSFDAALTLSLADPAGRSWFLARAEPESAGGRLILETTLRRDPHPRETLVMPKPNPRSAVSPSGSAESLAPADVPVTLVVELGRVNMPLHRLADLRPGDVVELARHALEPVELTSNGRLVARGELVQVDTELGVRVTHVFL